MNMWTLYLLLTILILQRIVELIIAKRNERWMKDRGGKELGEKHYKWIVGLHIVFFVTLIVETDWSMQYVELNYFLLFLFFLTQFARYWCILSLGKFWNTKIIVLPRVALIKKGPYKYIKHPNYIIVFIELIVIPLLFGAVWTASIFPLLHILIMFIRIPAENKALAKS